MGLTKSFGNRFYKFWIKIRVLFLFVVLFGLIGGSIYLLYFTDYFVLRKIEVKNNKKVKKEEIIKLTGLRGDERLFRISLKDIRNRLLKNSYIEDVMIVRKLPDTLEIIVKEREPLGIIKKAKTFYLIDKEGVIICPASSKDFDFYPLLELRNKDYKKKFLNFLKWIKENSMYLPVYANLSKIVLDKEKIYFYTKRRLIIYFPLVCEKDWIFLYKNLDKVVTYLYKKEIIEEVELIRMDYPLGSALIKFKEKI